MLTNNYLQIHGKSENPFWSTCRENNNSRSLLLGALPYQEGDEGQTELTSDFDMPANCNTATFSKSSWDFPGHSYSEIRLTSVSQRKVQPGMHH